MSDWIWMLILFVVAVGAFALFEFFEYRRVKRWGDAFWGRGRQSP